MDVYRLRRVDHNTVRIIAEKTAVRLSQRDAMHLDIILSLQTPTSLIYSKGNTRNFGRNRAWSMEKVIFDRRAKALICLQRGKNDSYYLLLYT